MTPIAGCGRLPPPRSRSFVACIAAHLRIMLLTGLLHVTNAGAHLFVTGETLDDALGSIEAHAAAEESDGETAEAEQVYDESLYRLGEAAWALAELMNEEVRAHGLEQWPLMTQGVERARALGVDIKWSEDHQRFFYDGAAYRRYLARVPGGQFAADSRYRLIELDFYLGEPDIPALAEKARAKREFLDDYPAFPARARVGLFLGIDYRDLYRLCLDEHADCEPDYAQLAIEQFRKIAEANADDDSGELARRLLERTLEEVEPSVR